MAPYDALSPGLGSGRLQGSMGRPEPRHGYAEAAQQNRRRSWRRSLDGARGGRKGAGGGNAGREEGGRGPGGSASSGERQVTATAMAAPTPSDGGA